MSTPSPVDTADTGPVSTPSPVDTPDVGPVSTPSPVDTPDVGPVSIPSRVDTADARAVSTPSPVDTPDVGPVSTPSPVDTPEAGPVPTPSPVDTAGAGAVSVPSLVDTTGARPVSVPSPIDTTEGAGRLVREVARQSRDDRETALLHGGSSLVLAPEAHSRTFRRRQTRETHRASVAGVDFEEIQTSYSPYLQGRGRGQARTKEGAIIMSHPIVPVSVHFDVSAVKRSAQTRVAAGTKVGAQAPQSPLYQQPEVKSAVDNVVAQTTATKAALDDNNKTHAAYVKSRTALAVLLAAWDGCFDILVPIAAKHCANGDDGASLGMGVRGSAKYTLAMPIAITATQNHKTNLLRVHAHRAPGMRATAIQMSADPISATSWKDLEGDGAVRNIPVPAPGTWWFRAAAKRAQAMSDFTAPVAIIVK